MIGDLLDELGELAKSKALRMRIRDQMQRSDRVRLSYYIASIVDLSQSHNGLGERQAAQELQEVVAVGMGFGPMAFVAYVGCKPPTD
jgi:hypothetical protein